MTAEHKPGDLSPNGIDTYGELEWDAKYGIQSPDRSPLSLEERKLLAIDKIVENLELINERLAQLTKK